MPEHPPVRLVVGLGNTGDRYAGTRHNAGFWLVDELVRRHGVALRADNRSRGEVARMDAGGATVHLLKPTTLMNRSGQAVGPVAGFYKIPPESVLVAHDELDLPPGTARIKRGGGHGGHNGLRDIERALGSRDFQRLRVGIGHPGHADDVVAYVLSRPSPADRRAIDEAVGDAADAVDLALGGQMDKAMQQLHTR
ncbi:MAG: aminoacyl-tRNA hydrolase [Ectothiorhodospiraceae bacterium]